MWYILSIFKYHIIILVDEKKVDKIQNSFLIKVINKLSIEGKCLNLIKAIYEKPTANIVSNTGRLNDLPLISGPRQGCLLSALPFNIILKALVREIRQIMK